MLSKEHFTCTKGMILMSGGQKSKCSKTVNTVNNTKFLSWLKILFYKGVIRFWRKAEGKLSVAAPMSNV